MVTRDQIITEARGWEGTPWQHQQSAKGVGVDCVNFIAEVGRASGAVSDVEFERNYRRESNGQVLLRLLREYDLERVSEADAQPADILVLIDQKAAVGGRKPEHWHLVILTEVEPYWSGIHSSEHGVREHRLDMTFRRRVHSVWRIKGLVA